VVKLGKPHKKKLVLVFVIDEFGRALTKESLDTLISELVEKALDERNIDVVAANGATINDCAYLTGQITGKDLAEWEVIYLHGSKYPPVLLGHDVKEKLVAMLPNYKGTSAEAVYKVLVDSDTFGEFTPK